uniref:NADH-ubiquinone oxidoreductase chain 4L n=1 Tax=Macrocheles muscaedomesticae TaxID=406086 RepID=A0A6B9WH11_9ACAR|nr:NADH dehydrogenase subunit 4L [Macrocheles muscaedomesticae]QHQ98531.1 NADH dehydrogenase subunit 4L [Macrocheles muscaedomesticae]
MLTYGSYIFMISFFSLVLNRDNIISVLLVLELMMVGLFLSFLPVMLIKMVIFMMFLVVVVCEASLGLGLLVLMVYYSGNDYVRSMEFLMD